MASVILSFSITWTVLKMKILIYWTESNSWIYFYIHVHFVVRHDITEILLKVAF
jgi:hypothetical protein